MPYEIINTYPLEQIKDIINELAHPRQLEWYEDLVRGTTSPNPTPLMWYENNELAIVQEAARVYCYLKGEIIVPSVNPQRTDFERVYVMLDGSATRDPHIRFLKEPITIPSDLPWHIRLYRDPRYDIRAASPTGTDVLVVPSFTDIKHLLSPGLH